MRGRSRQRAGQGVPAEVLARAAAGVREQEVRTQPQRAGLDPDRVPTPRRAPDWQIGRTLRFAALALVVIIAWVVRAPAGGDVEPYDEVAVALPPFEPDGPPRHDRADELRLERIDRVDATTIRVAGWAADTDRVEVISRGQVLATVPITIERRDTALANDLSGTFVGFDQEVTVPAGTGAVCLARPDQLPGVEACDRPILDMSTHRVVAFYGVPDEPPLGTLGDGEPDEVLERLVAQAEPYQDNGRPIMLAFEIIATVAQASPGSDGNYSAAIATEDIRVFAETIRAAGGVTVIDFQTGRDRYLDQIPDYLDFLREPDIHIALDPEWDMEAGEVPNEVIGSSEATEINEVMDYVADIIRTDRLPRKVVVVHNFTEGMIADRDLLDPPPEIDLVVHMDGHGPPQNKIGVYDRLRADPPFHNGFKLFYQRDTPLMTPEAVLTLDPAFISYQ